MDFFSPESQYLHNDLVLLPQEGAQTGGTGRPPNSYALLFGGYSVLFDAPFGYLLEEVDDLAKRGHPPAALVLSHRDLVGQGDATLFKPCKRPTTCLFCCIPRTTQEARSATRWTTHF